MFPQVSVANFCIGSNNNGQALYAMYRNAIEKKLR